MVEQRSFNIGFLKAAADLSAKKFLFVKVTADATVNVCTVAGENSIGVLQNAPISGKVCDVAVVGVTKVVVGTGNLAAGQVVESAADGRAIVATTGKSTLGTCIIGANVGEIATILLNAGHAGTLA